MTYHSFENVTMALLTHLVTSSYMLQVLNLLLFFGSVQCNSNEIQMIHPSRDCTSEFDDCQKEGRSAGLVCGTDGQSYTSACHLLYQTCISANNNQIGYNGACQYQYVDKEVAVVREKESTAGDTSSSSSEETLNSEDDSDEDITTTNPGGEAGSGDTGHQGEDDDDNSEDDSEEDNITTPKPIPPTSHPTKPAPMYCADKPGPLSCTKCGYRWFKKHPPKFDIEFPKMCTQGIKCSTDTIPPLIPGTAGPPVRSGLPMVARIAVAFFSIAFASMLAVVAFRLYSSRTINTTRNRQASDESRNQTEMTSRIPEKRSGSVQTYTSVV